MTNPYRAMCAELVAAVDLLCGSGDSPGQPGSRLILTVHVEALDELANRARALLAQQLVSPPYKLPEPEVPTDEELLRLAAEAFGYLFLDGGIGGGEGEFLAFARAALARWGRPTPQPVAVSERPWERDGWCDAEGRCYGWDGDYWWMVSNPGAVRETITHWLPANALPTPEAND